MRKPTDYAQPLLRCENCVRRNFPNGRKKGNKQTNYVQSLSRCENCAKRNFTVKS